MGDTMDVRSAMVAAFALVAPKSHWKDAVYAVVSVSSMEASGLTIYDVTESIAFYTATEAKTQAITGENGALWGYLVTAPGYRAGPAGDH
jgi:hypothetical protein